MARKRTFGFDAIGQQASFPGVCFGADSVRLKSSDEAIGADSDLAIAASGLGGHLAKLPEQEAVDVGQFAVSLQRCAADAMPGLLVEAQQDRLAAAR